MASETLMYTLWRESTLYGMKAHFTEWKYTLKNVLFYRKYYVKHLFYRHLTYKNSITQYGKKAHLCGEEVHHSGTIVHFHLCNYL